MPTQPSVTYWIGDENPTLPIWWFVNGSLEDFSSGWTFQGKLYRADDQTRTVLFTKTTGFTGAAGFGTETDGVPNLTVSWSTTADLNTGGITNGRHVFQIVATNNSAEMTQEMFLDLRTRV